MSAPEAAPGATSPAPPAPALPNQTVLPLLVFAATLLASAFLMFLLEFLMGKLILPRFGGTPAVWNTCMVFYQSLLLAGYTYSHLVTTYLPIRRQVWLHLGIVSLTLGAFFFMPIGVLRGFSQPEGVYPAFWVLFMLLILIGLPFFVISTSAPLMQRWFSWTGHPSAKDPYFLYGASNLGSLVGLLSYPFFVEPTLGLRDQGIAWMAGYVLMLGLASACAWLVIRGPGDAKAEMKDGPSERVIEEAPATETRNDSSPAPAEAVTSSPPADHSKMVVREEGLQVPTSTSKPEGSAASAAVTWKDRLRWIALAFVPSSLMLGVTTYMTTDIAAMPLLWMPPLALYLLSFILVFSKTTAGIHDVMVLFMPVMVLFLVFILVTNTVTHDVRWMFFLHLGTLFIVAMVCHGELARGRPAAQHLTGFFLCMSIGGVLGGFFNALVAPQIFNSIAEYPLVLALACICIPKEPQTEPGGGLLNQLIWWIEWAIEVALAAAGLYVLGLAVLQLVAPPGPTEPRYSHFPQTWFVPAVKSSWLAIAVLAAAGLALAGYLYRARDRRDLRDRLVDLILPAALGLIALEVFNASPFRDSQFLWIRRFVAVDAGQLVKLFTYVPLVVLCYMFAGRPVRFALGVGVLLLATALNTLPSHYQERSFFGVIRVEHDIDPSPQGWQMRTFLHGTTLHGAQRLDSDPTVVRAAARAAPLPLAAGTFLDVVVASAVMDEEVRARRIEPLTYFHSTGPIGQVFQALNTGPNVRRPWAVLGLGCGTLAGYANPGQPLTFYEIDPAAIRIAKEYFTYLKDSRALRDASGEIPIILGDGLLKLEEDKDKQYHILFMDAFSSDSIPVHLVTVEAVDLYFKRLAPDGVLMINVSNRYLTPAPVLANIAEKLGLVGLRFYDTSDADRERSGYIPGKTSSEWIILAKNKEALGDLRNRIARWPADPTRPWQELVVRPSAADLTAADLLDWQKNFLGRIYAEEVDRINREEPGQTPGDVRDQAEEKTAKVRAHLESQPPEEIKKLIQQEIDKDWDSQLAGRKRAGLWTNEFSNMIGILR